MSSYTIEVQGFLQDTTEEDIRDFFSRVGEVTGCILKNTTATVSFANEDDFLDALNMQGMEFGSGAFLEVRKKTTDHSRQETMDGIRNGASNAGTNDGGEAPLREGRKNFSDEFKVAVRNLSESTTEQHLRDLFEPLGIIGDLFLEPRRRYAFVGFDNAESFEAALQMTGRELNGVPIEVERKRTGPRENTLESKVVVKKLPPNTTDEDLRVFFASAGEPIDIFIHDKKQFAFVGFADEAACSAALRLTGGELNGSCVDIERRERQRCFKCDREGHVALQCRVSDVTCRNCGRPGHVARDCRAPPRDPRRNNYNNNNRRDFDRRGGYNNNNRREFERRGGYGNERRDVDRREYYDRRDLDRRDYGGDRRDHNGRRDVEGREDRRRARSRSDSYDRHHRRRSRSRSRSRSPKRFARERDRSRSPSRRRY